MANDHEQPLLTDVLEWYEGRPVCAFLFDPNTPKERLLRWLNEYASGFRTDRRSSVVTIQKRIGQTFFPHIRNWTARMADNALELEHFESDTSEEDRARGPSPNEGQGPQHHDEESEPEAQGEFEDAPDPSGDVVDDPEGISILRRLNTDDVSDLPELLQDVIKLIPPTEEFCSRFLSADDRKELQWNWPKPAQIPEAPALLDSTDQVLKRDKSLAHIHEKLFWIFPPVLHTLNLFLRNREANKELIIQGLYDIWRLLQHINASIYELRRTTALGNEGFQREQARRFTASLSSEAPLPLFSAAERQQIREVSKAAAEIAKRKRASGTSRPFKKNRQSFSTDRRPTNHFQSQFRKSYGQNKSNNNASQSKGGAAK
jgi:hypothetical protein